jgi:hypothetical protein
MKDFAMMTARHPGIYMACCFAIGGAVRLWMAHGDVGLFLNPLFPLFVH